MPVMIAAALVVSEEQRVVLERCRCDRARSWPQARDRADHRRGDRERHVAHAFDAVIVLVRAAAERRGVSVAEVCSGVR